MDNSNGRPGGPTQVEPVVSTLRASVPDAIRLIFRSDICAGVAKEWRAQYGNGYWAADKDKQNIQTALDALGPNPTPIDINHAIGNDSWTTNECDICGKSDCDVIARIGEEPDYEARWQDICLPCLAELGAWAAQGIQAQRAATTSAVHESLSRQGAPVSSTLADSDGDDGA